MTAGSDFDRSVVTLEVEGHVATVAFNRPEVLNACNMAVFYRLIEIFDEIADSPGIWCVILKGNGRAFCVGADQKERKTMSLDDIRRRRRISPGVFAAMRTCVKPVIAQVHGHAIGGGLEMAMGCDIVLVAEDASLGLVEVLRGSIPAGGGTQMLPRMIGIQRAKELIFTGRKFTGRDAAEWGLAAHAYPADELDARVRALAEEIVRAAPISVQQAKKSINMSMDLDLANGIQAEAALYERAMNTKDREIALKAYHDKVPAIFEGR